MKNPGWKICHNRTLSLRAVKEYKLCIRCAVETELVKEMVKI